MTIMMISRVIESYPQSLIWCLGGLPQSHQQEERKTVKWLLSFVFDLKTQMIIMGVMTTPLVTYFLMVKTEARPCGFLADMRRYRNSIVDFLVMGWVKTRKCKLYHSGHKDFTWNQFWHTNFDLGKCLYFKILRLQMLLFWNPIS